MVLILQDRVILSFSLLAEGVSNGKLETAGTFDGKFVENLPEHLLENLLGLDLFALVLMFISLILLQVFKLVLYFD